jgi:tetratricopeptide (TPR) repeat protein
MAWGQDPEGQLVIWAPGMTVAPPTPGVAWRLDPKTSLVLHAHMQPSGKPEIVKFRIGIYFAKQPPEKHPAMLRIGSCDIDIPAGERLHVVEDRFELPIDVDIHTIFPHAHSLCRELRVVAERPDGSRESLIQIDRFDENWHDSYRYQKPVRLPRGTKLVSTFAYDNSDDNPRNRNHPARRVVYGSNAQDEMADVYLQVTAVHADQRAILMEDYKHYDLRSQLVGHRKSLELYPDDPWAQEAVAAAYVGQGEPAKAIPILEGRLKSGPKAVFPVVSLGMALLQSGKADSAEQHLRRATEMDGNYPLAWLGLGKALFAQKKLDGAEPALRRAIELAPSLNDARLALADLLIQRDKLDEAKAICSAVSSEALDMSAVCLKLAEISAKQREYSASLDYCRQAQALAPYTHPPKVLLAVFCVANGDIDRGHALLQDAAAESPQHPMPLLMLGQLARRRQQSRPALEYLTMSSMLPIPDNWPQSHRQRFLVLLHSERFQLAQQINDISLARDALTQWIKCDPSNPQLPKMLSQLPAK